MKALSTQQLVPRPPDEQQASLGPRHGYCIEQDIAYLHAMFRVHTAAANGRSWTLQLWACSSLPEPGAALTGHLVTEASLPPICEIADDTLAFETSAFTHPPASGNEYVMALALGVDGEIHDLAVYPYGERFVAPQLRGSLSYSVDGSRVEISVERIENPRRFDNVSGTLALELWALPARYHGGAFRGVPLAGVAIDALAGQWETTPRSFDLPFTPPPVGSWQIVLMLREWTPIGFVTRDYVNFEVAYIEGAPSQVPAPVAAKAPTAKKKSSAPRNRIAEPTLAEALRDGGVSINRAGVDDLASVKGLTRKLAEAVVRERPFRTLNDLLRVKGMGAKLLTKVRPGLKL